jgi:tyrosyl-tRNA synthetase
LAYEVTKLVHGPELADKQQHITNVLFSSEGISELDATNLSTIREEFPNLSVPASSSLVDALSATGLVQSNSEARRLLLSGAVYINGVKTEHENFEENDFQNGRLLLRRGKAFKDTALIELI